MTATSELVGPGSLVLVIGPSGAGKDSLIRAARAAFAGDAAYVFPRRVITRPPSDAEDSEALDPAAFARLSVSGAFAVSWTAHGLRDARRVEIDRSIRAGRTVVCNVSRTVVDRLRLRYANVRVIEVTAPDSVLAARLASRERPEDGDLTRRLARSRELGLVQADVVILNAGPLDEACGHFLRALGGPGGRDGADAAPRPSARAGC